MVILSKNKNFVNFSILGYKFEELLIDSYNKILICSQLNKSLKWNLQHNSNIYTWTQSKLFRKSSNYRISFFTNWNFRLSKMKRTSIKWVNKTKLNKSVFKAYFPSKKSISISQKLITWIPLCQRSIYYLNINLLFSKSAKLRFQILICLFLIKTKSTVIFSNQDIMKIMVFFNVMFQHNKLWLKQWWVYIKFLNYIKLLNHSLLTQKLTMSISNNFSVIGSCKTQFFSAESKVWSLIFWLNGFTTKIKI